jgi:hypothetical protein
MNRIKLETFAVGQAEAFEHVAKSQVAIEDSMALLRRLENTDVARKSWNASPAFRRTRPGSRRTTEKTPEPYVRRTILRFRPILLPAGRVQRRASRKFARIGPAVAST